MRKHDQSPVCKAGILVMLLIVWSVTVSGCGTHGSPDGVRSYEFNGYRGNEFRKLPEQPRRIQTNDTAPAADPLPVNLHTNTRVEWSPFLEERITAIDGISGAQVAVTESQAYVAVELENVSRTPVTLPAPADDPISDSTDMPQFLQQLIVATVNQAADPVIQHVFVSANEQFTAEMKQLRAISNEQETSMWIQAQVLNRIANNYFPDLDGTGAYPGSIGSGQVSRPRGGGEGMYSPSTGVRQK
ncbi:YhcN/YlaJ family sporulation lipoprotein [Paenibacillus senegalensis]|uniref:YhcN/YlaJ family sporulation lipoprotein n=1 Tax=Paenibacillus senegalensis TaxID=1465766 RepID=UPI00028986B4|nr:YhcN/YlaJ family sporulation lipoprotein [Paenibacillus senegalensis]